MMGINAVKGVEIGAGFACIAQNGTEHSDEMTPDGFLSNNAGGILGGISTGQDIVVTLAIKPTSWIRLERRSIDKAGRPVTVDTHGRHDPCVGIRATPIAEAMLAMVLIDHALRHRAQNADVRIATPKIAALAPAGRRRNAAPAARSTIRTRTKRRTLHRLRWLPEFPAGFRSRRISPPHSRRVIVAPAVPRANVSSRHRRGRSAPHRARRAVGARDDRVAAIEHRLRIEVRQALPERRHAVPPARGA